MISLIAAMDRNRAIGRGNALPWHLPDDLKHFKQVTLGKPVVMGRKTFESLGCRPLPGRPNLVVSRQGVHADGVAVFATLEAALLAAQCQADEVMVIGGGQIYAQALPLAERLYLTRVETEIEDADTWFPEWDRDAWQLLEETHHPADERHPWPFYLQTWGRRDASEADSDH